MPTDWSSSGTYLVRKIRTRFYGNPRYLEVADRFLEINNSTVASNLMFNDEAFYGEEGIQENSRHLENEIFNDLQSETDAEETTETVWMLLIF